MKPQETFQSVPKPRSTSVWLSYASFYLCASFYLLPFMRTILIRSDEGIFFCGASRIVQGQVFSRDFIEIVGPGSLYWMAAFFKLFGATFPAARAAMFIPLLGTAVAVYYLSRQVCSRLFVVPALLLAGPYFGLLGQVESHHTDSNCLALLATACLFHWNSSRHNSLLVVAGALAGLCTTVLQPKGILLFGSALVWFFLQRKNKTRPLLAACLTTVGFVSVLALTVGYFWSQKALGSLIYADYILPTQTYGAANALPYAHGLQGIWASFLTQPDGLHWPAAIAIVFFLPFLIIAALPALVLLLGIGYEWKSISPQIILLWLSGWALWLSEYHRRDIRHLAYGAPLLMILCVHMLAQNRWRAVRIAVTAATVCAVCSATLNCVVAAEIPTTQTTVGPAAVFGAGSAPVLHFLKDHLKPGEDAFFYPSTAVYYFLSSTNNPTPYSGLYYGQSSPAQFQEVIRILDRKEVRYVVWDTIWLPNLSKNGEMPGSLPSDPKQLIFEPWLQSHYHTVLDAEGTLIMERNRD